MNFFNTKYNTQFYGKPEAYCALHVGRTNHYLFVFIYNIFIWKLDVCVCIYCCLYGFIYLIKNMCAA